MTDRKGVEVAIRLDDPVVLNVEFEVRTSELVALVGPSGGGKSTILRVIAGFAKPTEGKISIGAQSWFDSQQNLFVQPRHRRVGMVFQSYALFPHLSAFENVLEAITDRPAADRIELANEYLARVNLKGLGERLPEQMSGGQRQRVAVARALAREPHVLLLDEPFSAVDKVTRIRLQRELVDLRSDLSIPIILVTHDIEEAARLADRIAVLHEGRILQMASHEKLSKAPVNIDVARLVGIRNIFNSQVATIDSEQDRLELRWGSSSLEMPFQDGYTPGQAVTWCVPSDGIVVHRRNRPSRGEHENPVFGIVNEVFHFGQTTELTIEVDDPDAHPLHCSVPTHVAERNEIDVGADLGVSIKADMIHIMGSTDA
ncbi:MAG: ABC transporter ATP-binding protein [Gammaproteobacteria bacterium]|nr:ABC transporter ATP-binding protein [Gammaproteobacteria bacterium]